VIVTKVEAVAATKTPPAALVIHAHESGLVVPGSRSPTTNEVGTFS
jgi:hypothetical protein